MTDQFQHIKSDDRKNLEEVLQVLRESGHEVSLKGSATNSSNYQDIDLLAEKQADQPDLWTLGNMVKTLKTRGDVRLLWHLCGQDYVGTRVDSRCHLNYNGTVFDVSYKAKKN